MLLSMTRLELVVAVFYRRNPKGDGGQGTGQKCNDNNSRERLYTPPPSPHFWPEGIFQGRGGGCIFRGPTRQEFYTPPPPFIRPPPLEGYFQGWGGGGV